MKHTSIGSWLKVAHFVFWVQVEQTKHSVKLNQKVLKGYARHLLALSNFIRFTAEHLIMSTWTQKTFYRAIKELSIDPQ